MYVCIPVIYFNATSEYDMMTQNGCLELMYSDDILCLYCSY